MSRIESLSGNTNVTTKHYNAMCNKLYDQRTLLSPLRSGFPLSRRYFKKSSDPQSALMARPSWRPPVDQQNMRHVFT